MRIAESSICHGMQLHGIFRGALGSTSRSIMRPLDPNADRLLRRHRFPLEHSFWMWLSQYSAAWRVQSSITVTMGRSMLLKHQSTDTMRSATCIFSSTRVGLGRRSGGRSENARCSMRGTTAKIHTITGSGPAEGILSPMASGRAGAFGLGGQGGEPWGGS